MNSRPNSISFFDPVFDLNNPGWVSFGNLYKTDDQNDGFTLQYKDKTIVDCESTWGYYTQGIIQQP